MPYVTNFLDDPRRMTLVLENAVQYADNEVLSITAALVLQGSGASVAGGGSFPRGKITSVLALDKDDQGQNLDVVFLDSNVGIGTLNAAVTLADADAEKVLGIVPVRTWYNFDNNQFGTADFDPIPFNLETVASHTIYVATISRGTGTYTASGIILTIGFEMQQLGR